MSILMQRLFLSVYQTTVCILMDVWVVLGFTHRMWASPTKAVNSSHGALSEQWTKQNPPNILKMIHLCDTASLFDRAFQSGYGQVKQESPHRCARWVKSKLHSQPRPAATNVTTSSAFTPTSWQFRHSSVSVPPLQLLSPASVHHCVTGLLQMIWKQA